MMRAARTARRSQAAACHAAMHQSHLPPAMLVFLQYFKQLNTIIKQLSALLMQLDKLQTTNLCGGYPVNERADQHRLDDFI